MNYYEYHPAANDFAGVAAAHIDNRRVLDVHFHDTPFAATWSPTVLHGFDEDSLAEGDFPSLSNFRSIPLVTELAWLILKPVIGYCCEVLPVVYPTGGSYFIVHVMETIDCLDLTRSEVRRSKIDGRINRIFKYVFEAEKLRGKHIFKLPREHGRELIVDDVFRKVVESNNLVGLQFKELPMAESL